MSLLYINRIPFKSTTFRNIDNCDRYVIRQIITATRCPKDMHIKVAY